MNDSSSEFVECPFNEDDTLKKVSFVKPTAAHEKYDVGDIVEVMYSPTQEVLVLEKLNCKKKMCQFVGYSLYDKKLKVFYFHNIKDISLFPKIRKTNYDEYKHILDKNMEEFLELITKDI